MVEGLNLHDNRYEQVIDNTQQICHKEGSKFLATLHLAETTRSSIKLENWYKLLTDAPKIQVVYC